MKKVILMSVVMAASLPMIAQADPGCGLGAQVFAGKDGAGSHILAATTNGISGNQTFGMSSGTLGCDTSKKVTYAAGIYLNSNMEKVARGMATGEGEALNTLADLMGVQTEDKAAFFTAMQKNFGKIFKGNSVSAEDVMASLKSVMQQDSSLSKYIS
ncbi:MAG: DUF3015 domain-containing protein [Gammaproteobacteria bacterium]|nr:DUF3015 domain-containing protein [Gammaproteobacteria bacterium]